MSVRPIRSLIRRSLNLAGLSAAVTALALSMTASSADAHNRKHHRHYRTHVVEAPFTTVETRHHRRNTHVRAPFTRVHVTAAGTYVRAPFVRLFVPR